MTPAEEQMVKAMDEKAAQLGLDVLFASSSAARGRGQLLSRTSSAPFRNTLSRNPAMPSNVSR